MSKMHDSRSLTRMSVVVVVVVQSISPLHLSVTPWAAVF